MLIRDFTQQFLLSRKTIMATVSELKDAPTSGLNHIDALLDKGPDWNYLTSPLDAQVPPTPQDTIYYTFSVAGGNEKGRIGQEAFTLAQQGATHSAFAYISSLTGIKFVETVNGAQAQIHLCNLDIEKSNVVGLCSWTGNYLYDPATDAVTGYDADAYVYLDNAEWRAINTNLVPGLQGYETLLHELGHALGLKHPFEEEVHLPGSQDNTGNTLMSYTSAGGPHKEYSQYDVAALNWLYGRDGLRGDLGINSKDDASYITGTAGADVLPYDHTLQGNGGNDMIDGGEGIDTVVFGGSRNAYTFSTRADGATVVSSASGTDTLRSVEMFQFTDMTVERAAVNGVVAAPTLAVAKNANHYAFGNKALVTGFAEANATIRVYLDNALIGTAQASADGVWQLTTQVLSDRLNYRIHATATDAAGITSAASETSTFHVDAIAPTVPSGNVVLHAGANQPVFSGTGEAGTEIQLFRTSDFTEIGRAAVGSDGHWTLNSAPLPNGAYEISFASVDKAGNATSGAGRFSMNIASPGGEAGTAGDDVFTMRPGNNAIDGQGGIDVAVYDGARADYAVSKNVWGSVVRDKAGATDGLYGVERIQFDDGWLALDGEGIAGQVYRLYKAAFDRVPDEVGFGFWLWRTETGSSLLTVAEEFMTNQPEFDKMYGLEPSDEVFLTNLYRNVLDRTPDADGFAYWLTRVDDSSRAQILTEFSESVENKSAVIDLIGQGMAFTPWEAA